LLARLNGGWKPPKLKLPKFACKLWTRKLKMGKVLKVETVPKTTVSTIDHYSGNVDGILPSPVPVAESSLVPSVPLDITSSYISDPLPPPLLLLEKYFSSSSKQRPSYLSHSSTESLRSPHAPLWPPYVPPHLSSMKSLERRSSSSSDSYGCSYRSRSSTESLSFPYAPPSVPYVRPPLPSLKNLASYFSSSDGCYRWRSSTESLGFPYVLPSPPSLKNLESCSSSSSDPYGRSYRSRSSTESFSFPYPSQFDSSESLPCPIPSQPPPSMTELNPPSPTYREVPILDEFQAEFNPVSSLEDLLQMLSELGNESGGSSTMQTVFIHETSVPRRAAVIDPFPFPFVEDSDDEGVRSPSLSFHSRSSSLPFPSPIVEDN